MQMRLTVLLNSISPNLFVFSIQGQGPDPRRCLSLFPQLS